eukprot:4439358-Amphidinium_carterae.3
MHPETLAQPTDEHDLDQTYATGVPKYASMRIQKTGSSTSHLLIQSMDSVEVAPERLPPMQSFLDRRCGNSIHLSTLRRSVFKNSTEHSKAVLTACISHFGVSHSVQTDDGPEFRSLLRSLRLPYTLRSGASAFRATSESAAPMTSQRDPAEAAMPDHPDVAQEVHIITMKAVRRGRSPSALESLDRKCNFMLTRGEASIARNENLEETSVAQVANVLADMDVGLAYVWSDDSDSWTTHPSKVYFINVLDHELEVETPGH